MLVMALAAHTATGAGVSRPKKGEHPLIRPVCGALASCTAEACTMPIDVTKARTLPPTAPFAGQRAIRRASRGASRQRLDRAAVLSVVLTQVRMQLAKDSSVGFLGTLSAILSNEGGGALFKGLKPALLRQVHAPIVYGGTAREAGS